MSPTILRRVQKTLLVIGLVLTVTLASVVVAAYRNDSAINEHKGTVMADIVSADRLHAVAYFQTPDGQIYSPRLGLLYPTELATGQRISVEYDTTNPDVARPTGRTAALSIIPVLSVIVIVWVALIALMLIIAEANRRWLSRLGRSAVDASADPGAPGDPDTTDLEESSTQPTSTP